MKLITFEKKNFLHPLNEFFFFSKNFYHAIIKDVQIILESLLTKLT